VPLADAVAAAEHRLAACTSALAALLATDPDRALANATLYLDAFGRVVAAWVWLRLASAACRGLAGTPDQADIDFYRGKVHAARYYIEWELPVTQSQFALLGEVNAVPLEMRDAWFG
jgi:butyryl-CoA dehydrogenase